MAGAVVRLSLNVPAGTVQSLEQVRDEHNLTLTMALVRQLNVASHVDQLTRIYGQLYVRNLDTGEFERVHIVDLI